MNIYIESNFILELALLQEQYKSCEDILSLCEKNKAILILPAFCIAEPYETLTRRTSERFKLAKGLRTELKQLSRSSQYKSRVDALYGMADLLVQTGMEYESRLQQTFNRVLNIADIIPLGPELLSSATEFRTSFRLSPQDSIVYASVLQHLTLLSETTKKCFLNRNSKDFDDPDIVDTINNYGCKMLFSFDNGYNYIRSQVS